MLTCRDLVMKGMESDSVARVYAHPPYFGSQNDPCHPCLGSSAWSLTICSVSSSKANRTLVNYDPMDEIQIAEINSQVRRYLEGTLDEIDVINLRQIQEVFNQFRVVLR